MAIDRLKAACSLSERRWTYCRERSCRPSFRTPLLYKGRHAGDYGILSNHWISVSATESQLVVEELRRQGLGRPPICEVNWSSPFLRQRLINLDAYLCPHLRTSDPAFYDLLLDRIYRKGSVTPKFVIREGDTYWPTQLPLHRRGDTDICCHVDENCGAIFDLNAICKSGRLSTMKLHVTRPFQGTTVRCQSWLAKTEVDKSGSND